MTLSETPVIDTHVHVWQPEYIPSALRMSWAEAASYRRPGPGRSPDEIYRRVSQDIRDPDAAHLVAAMDIAGVAQSVILGVDYGPDAWAATRTPARTVMQRYDEICRQSGGRFSFAAGVHPARPGALLDARNYLASDMCRGIKFYPPAGFRADEPMCEPVYGALIETDKAAIFHTASVRGLLNWANAQPLNIVAVQARHPEMKIVLAHGGFPCWWDECVALAASHPRTYIEVSLWQEEALTAPGTFLPMLERAIRLCGADRILFASDTMYGSKKKGADNWKRWVEFFRTLPLQTDGRISETDVANMIYHNARDVFFGASKDTPMTVSTQLSAHADRGETRA